MAGESAGGRSPFAAVLTSSFAPAAPRGFRIANCRLPIEIANGKSEIGNRSPAASSTPSSSPPVSFWPPLCQTAPSAWPSRTMSTARAGSHPTQAIAAGVIADCRLPIEIENGKSEIGNPLAIAVHFEFMAPLSNSPSSPRAYQTPAYASNPTRPIPSTHCGSTGQREVSVPEAGSRSRPHTLRPLRPPGGGRDEKETELHWQILEFFDRFKVQDGKVREWIVVVLRAKTHDAQEATANWQEDLQRQPTETQNRLLNLRLAGEIDPQTFAKKSTDLRDTGAALRLCLDAREWAGMRKAIWQLDGLNCCKP